MAQKCIILYKSDTGNTEKVAKVFRDTFVRNGWKCDLVKVDENTKFADLPDYQSYDFMCVGSPVKDSLCHPEVIYCLRKATKEESKKGIPHEKIVFDGKKKGIVFVTYSGAHLGPKEASAALAWLELELEHQKFECIGRYCCPGVMTVPGTVPGTMRKITDTSTWFHGDISDRPNARDLKRAEIFIEDKLEEIAVRHK